MAIPTTAPVDRLSTVDWSAAGGFESVAGSAPPLGVVDNDVDDAVVEVGRVGTGVALFEFVPSVSPRVMLKMLVAESVTCSPSCHAAIANMDEYERS